MNVIGKRECPIGTLGAGGDSGWTELVSVRDEAALSAGVAGCGEHGDAGEVGAGDRGGSA